MSQEHSNPPTRFTSWPPSPGLLQVQLSARALVLLTDVIGLSLLFAVGSENGDAPAFVSASFLTTSLTITPLIMLWNKQLLRRVRKLRHKQSQFQDADKSAPRFKTKFLRFSTFLEGFGAIAFFAVFFPAIHSAAGGDNWWWSSASARVTYAYGTVSILCALVIHAFLFLTQALQICSAIGVHRAKKLVCPHCNHTMARVSTSSEFRTPPESIMPTHNDDMLVDSLVDARVSMNPGQETGTTFKTPRQSEHQSRTPAPASREGEANEAGEGEQDTLISKAG